MLNLSMVPFRNCIDASENTSIPGFLEVMFALVTGSLGFDRACRELRSFAISLFDAFVSSGVFFYVFFF